MDAPTSSRDGQESVSTVLEYLLRRSGEKISDVAPRIGVNANTLYSLSRRCSTKADLRTLKKIADYFGEDLSIFCGLESYAPPVRLSREEAALVESFRALPPKRRAAAAELLSGMASGSLEGAAFAESFAALSDTARRRVLELVEDMLEVPKNRRPEPGWRPEAGARRAGGKR